MRIVFLLANISSFWEVFICGLWSPFHRKLTTRPPPPPRLLYGNPRNPVGGGWGSVDHPILILVLVLIVILFLIPATMCPPALRTPQPWTAVPLVGSYGTYETVPPPPPVASNWDPDSFPGRARTGQHFFSEKREF